MNPFGPSKCPRCDKTVYAAEQIIGPGRQVYHKFCLKCTSCNKRLDSYSLVEHNQEPYCKPCHVRGFGTRDLRQHNLAPSSPPGSPSSRNAQPASPPPSIDKFADRFSKPSAPQAQNDPPLTPPRTVSPATEVADTESPDTENFEPPATEPATQPNDVNMSEPSKPSTDRDVFDAGSGDVAASPSPPLSNAPALPPRPGGTSPLKNTYNFEYRSKAGMASRFPAPLSPSAIKKGSTGFAALRSGPPSPTRRTAESPTRRAFGETPISPTATGTSDGSASMRPIPSTPTGGTLRGMMQSSTSSPARPLSQTPTGIRPMMTGGSSTSSPIRPMATGGAGGNVFGGRVECPRCGKAVYHAEQVSGPGGRKYHKICLRCVQCNAALDSGRLTEKDGEPMCRNCYSKTHGPQGSGYALIGRAG